jgi:small GTP-binding protein
MNQQALRDPGSRQRTLQELDELLVLTAGLLPAGQHRDLDAARKRVAEDRFNLVVLGEFKRGKSTLINALLERELLPVGVVPLTSVVTVIGAPHSHAARGDERLLIRFVNGRERERPVDELEQYVTEARNPANRLGVELARVELDHELLRAGLELVDTPGIGSIHSHNTDVARGFLPHVDAALCVLDAGQPLSEAERQLFAEAAQRVPRLLMVVNKIDHLDPADREVALEFIRSALTELLGRDNSEMFALSARRGDGMETLVSRLWRLAQDEREALLLRSVAGLAHSTAADGAQAARFEAHAIELPLEELSSRAQVFEQRIEELRAASAEASDLLERGVQRALTELVNEPLTEHARKEGPRLLQALRKHVQQLGKRPPRELQAALDQWIDETVRAEFEALVPRFEQAIANALSELERRFAERVRRILEQVQEVAEDVFGARSSDVLPETGLHVPSRFTFKLKDPEHGLEMLVGFGRTITPGALGRRLVVRDAEDRLVAMADRHAGRLRSELAGRVNEASRAYRRELQTAVEETIEAIRAAIDRVRDDRSRGERHARERLDRLERIEQRCEAMRLLFEATSTGADGAKRSAPERRDHGFGSEEQIERLVNRAAHQVGGDQCPGA